VAWFGLVRRSPGLAGLLAAQTVSPLGDAMATTALILHVQRTAGSATTVGLLLFAQAIPPLAAPFAGVVADRFPPGRVLTAGWLAQVILAGLLALLLPLGAARGGLRPGPGRYAAVRGGRPVHPGRGGR
jgi:hypothetical protein